jgi:hypothetical protein
VEVKFEDVMGAEPPIPENVVDHPRFGKQPRRSKAAVNPAARGHWNYRRTNSFWTTAIPADPTKQNAMYPTEFYVDVIEICRNCERPFFFFAEEQKHWYEDLGFEISSWCVQCVDCRKTEQFFKKAFHRYGTLIKRTDLSDDELVQLLEDTTVLTAA